MGGVWSHKERLGGVATILKWSMSGRDREGGVSDEPSIEYVGLWFEEVLRVVLCLFSLLAN